jgi:hypothetical protein
VRGDEGGGRESMGVSGCMKERMDGRASQRVNEREFFIHERSNEWRLNDGVLFCDDE